MRRIAFAIVSLLAAWPSAASGQQSVADFYRGNYIPGKPIIVPRNMPGAGSRAAANWIYNIAPRDGTVLATADQSLSLQQAAGDKRINFDTTKFIYIGTRTSRTTPPRRGMPRASRRSMMPSAARSQ